MILCGQVQDNLCTILYFIVSTEHNYKTSGLKSWQNCNLPATLCKTFFHLLAFSKYSVSTDSSKLPDEITFLHKNGQPLWSSKGCYSIRNTEKSRFGRDPRIWFHKKIKGKVGGFVSKQCNLSSMFWLITYSWNLFQSQVLTYWNCKNWTNQEVQFEVSLPPSWAESNQY